MMEIWDAYNAELKLNENLQLYRGQEIPEGVYHLVCDILVQHADGTYLLMQRDVCKHYGGMWEATAGGSALQGETPLQCAIRELREETGIISSDLREVGRVVSDETRSIYVEFFCVTDGDKEKIALQDGETSDFRWVSKDELLSMKKDELITMRMEQFMESLK
jgi:8-oxo-dGTP pyrophosphatase MutT (NUDIX family)